MLTSNKLQIALQKHGGVLTTAEANASGISNEQLCQLVRSGELERMTHGVYISPNEFIDRMYVAGLRWQKIIYSHETALFLHGLADRDPIQYSVTVPSGYNTKAILEDGMNVFTIKRELHRLGVIQMETTFGHMVTTYGLERTICDCIRSRNKMDIAVVSGAVKRYVKRSDKDLNVLMEMAETFRITKPLRNYMEVLLRKHQPG